MPSYRDLLKYAKTGIAAPGMSYRDMLRARAIWGGFPVNTIEGVPPLTFQSDGKPLISWSIYGNGQQTGTPTPDNPIQPEFVGVRTGNLFDVTTSVPGLIEDSGNIISNFAYGSSEFIRIDTDFTISLLSVYTLSARLIRVGYYTENKQHIVNYESKSFRDGYYVLPFTPPDGTAYIRFSFIAREGYEDSNIMLNTGDTALPFEPFGYKIPISCASQTVPVYLGEAPTLRRIKKLVLTGSEAWEINNRILFRLALSESALRYEPIFSTHFISKQSFDGVYNTGNSIAANLSSLYANSTEYSENLDGWKAYIAQQYANGTPVTVWYVLAEPTTGIVNEPLAKIGDYADELRSADSAVTIQTAKGENTLTVDTDLPPSSVSITGHIK